MMVKREREEIQGFERVEEKGQACKQFCCLLEVIWHHYLSGVLSTTKSSLSPSRGFVVVPTNYGMKYSNLISISNITLQFQSLVLLQHKIIKLKDGKLLALGILRPLSGQREYLSNIHKSYMVGNWKHQVKHC